MKDSKKIIYMLTIIFIAGALLICIGRSFSKAFNTREIIATVTGKTVKNYGNSGKYLIYTKDSDDEIKVLEVTDSWLRFRFNSSDVYAGIEVGNTYKFTVGGSRIELFSWYPNVYEYELIKESD